jgi:mannitol-1-/sugar-/sorbitol-6-phosphatase
MDQLAEGLGNATPGHLSLWGTMHLRAALIAAYWNNREDAAAHLREAEDAAQRLGRDGNHYDTMFGPTNVAIHHVAVAVELGNAKAAIEHASRINASGLGRERRARLAIDLARAFEHARKHDKATGIAARGRENRPRLRAPAPDRAGDHQGAAPSIQTRASLTRQADRCRVTMDPTTVDVTGLLFDNDGVLIDSTAAVEASWRAFAGWYELPADDVLTRVHGRRSRDVIAHYADRLPVDPDEAFDRYIAACVHDFAEVTVLPGVAELIDSLPAHGWAVVTSGTKIVTQARMAAAGLPNPPVLVTAEDVPAGKPDPAPYRIAAERLHLDPTACLAVEDSPPGLTSAQTAGCMTLALLTTHQQGELRADLHATNLAAVQISHNGGFHISISSRRFQVIIPNRPLTST